MCRMPPSPSEALVAEGEVVRTSAPAPRVRVGFAPVKGDRVEGVVQKLTELGVDRIELLETERSVVRWRGERAARQQDRLAEVVRAAASQCRRLWLPELRLSGGGGPLPAGALADAGGRPMRASDTTVLVGPEGGWTDAERASRELIGLGPHVLRADTAAVVAAAMMAGLRSGLVAPAAPEGSTAC
jgi:16S rRNA (uracil1498-N3)-methyltransferase